jgi:hypothetical protein
LTGDIIQQLAHRGRLPLGQLQDGLTIFDHLQLPALHGPASWRGYALHLDSSSSSRHCRTC